MHPNGPALTPASREQGSCGHLPAGSPPFEDLQLLDSQLLTALFFPCASPQTRTCLEPTIFCTLFTPPPRSIFTDLYRGCYLHTSI